MIILNFNSTCFEHTSDDCFFFYNGKKFRTTQDRKLPLVSKKEGEKKKG